MSGERTALVTGGLRGIGRGIVEALLAEEYTVLVADLDSEREAHQEWALPRGVYYSRTDIADPAARRDLVSRVETLFGAPRVLVNNAGIAPAQRVDILEATEESFERVMRVNLQGPYFLTQQIARLMVAARRTEQKPFHRCIINISSSNAVAASIARGEYCISKAGVSMATKLWSVRLAEYGIPVYEILPGLIKTRMTEVVQEKYDRLIADGFVPLGRWGYPADVGKAVAMLARGDLPYSTGERIRVDGGQMLERF
ncbi:MAG: 3-ketoacyl-ACP reductase [Spirochaetaceae bacterium]|nr:MAG: 3-ketoacyl-ACP reductase [Spirochaetaceae bacterium]